MQQRTDRRRAIAVIAAAMTAGALSDLSQAQGAGGAQTLRGAAAQNSPQADVFIAYDDALLAGGLEAARKHMSPAKVEEFEAQLKTFGVESFKAMQAQRRATQKPAAVRRKLIDKVEIKGDYAVLEARTEQKGVLDEVAFLKTKDGWKVTPVRR